VAASETRLYFGYNHSVATWRVRYRVSSVSRSTSFASEGGKRPKHRHAIAQRQLLPSLGPQLFRTAVDSIVHQRVIQNHKLLQNDFESFLGCDSSNERRNAIDLRTTVTQSAIAKYAAVSEG